MANSFNKDLKEKVTDVFYCVSLYFEGKISREYLRDVREGNIKKVTNITVHKSKSSGFFQTSRFNAIKYTSYAHSTIFVYAVINQYKYNAKNKIDERLCKDDIIELRSFITNWRSHLAIDVQLLMRRCTSITTEDEFYETIFNLSYPTSSINDINLSYINRIRPISLYLMYKYNPNIARTSTLNSLDRILLGSGMRLFILYIEDSISQEDEVYISNEVSKIDTIFKFVLSIIKI